MGLVPILLRNLGVSSICMYPGQKSLIKIQRFVVNTEFKNFNFNCTSRFADGQKPKIYFFIEKSRKNVVLSINQTISKLLKNKKNKGEWYLAT